ncbi:anti-repressor SinI family protein [Natribacillus halophilus]|uniref:Anti-repressor SinI n=1 Tax=Natribacillus halophilus TaxID=549003 RepID=A0A1G8KT69_9BACI|nr:anti-repressor SinI family protein [Natribacillus halophilus]SDI46562.1 Anti-repressor SinI [Natribacillus halophilus]
MYENLKREGHVSNVNHMNVDPEWVELIKEARDMGISKEHIGRFFEEATVIKNT